MIRFAFALLALTLLGSGPPPAKTLRLLVELELSELPPGKVNYSVASYKLQDRALMQDSARMWFRGEYEIAKPRKLKLGETAKLSLKVSEARNLYHRVVVFFEAEDGSEVAPESAHGVLLGWSEAFQLGDFESWEKKSGYSQMPKAIAVGAPIEVSLAAKAGGESLEDSGYRYCFEAAGFESGAPVVRLSGESSELQLRFLLSPLQARARWAFRVERTGGMIRPQNYQSGLLPRSGPLTLEADFSALPVARFRALQTDGSPAVNASVQVSEIEGLPTQMGKDDNAAGKFGAAASTSKREPGWNFSAAFDADASGLVDPQTDETGLVQLGILSWPHVRLDIQGADGSSASTLARASELTEKFEVVLGGEPAALIPADHPAWSRLAEWRSKNQLLDLAWVQTNGMLTGSALQRQGGTQADIGSRQPRPNALRAGEPGAWIVCALVDEGAQLAWYLDIFALHGPTSMHQHQVPGPPPLSQTSIRLGSLAGQGFPFGAWIDEEGEIAHTELAWPPDADGLFRPLVLYGVPKSGCVLFYPTTGPNSIVWNQVELKETD
jgi:hypothetical protein